MLTSSAASSLSFFNFLESILLEVVESLGKLICSGIVFLFSFFCEVYFRICEFIIFSEYQYIFYIEVLLKCYISY